MIAEEEIDDDLTLLMARSTGVPRLGIFNTYSEKKKYVPMSWIEGAERTLKIKVGKNTKEYDMKVITDGVGSLIKRASDQMSLNSLAWRGIQLLGDMVQVPKTARSDADLNLIAENKKDTLWFVYTPKKGKWRVLPCFAPSEAERPVLEKYCEGDRPWSVPAITIENGSLATTLRNAPFVKELIAANHARWTDFLMPVAKGMLLGFSDWAEKPDRAFGNALWQYLPKQDYRSDATLNALLPTATDLLSKLTAYIRLWPLLNDAKIEMVSDASKTSEERGWKKKERFEMGVRDRNFKVTRVVDEGKIAGFAVIPDTRLPGEQDRLVSMAEESWDVSLTACALGAEKDPQYTCASVLSAIETREWYTRIGSCINGGASAQGDKGDEE